MTALKSWLRFKNTPLLRRFVTVEIILLTWVMSSWLHGGEDLFKYYYPLASGCPQCGFLPWYATWVFFPLKFVPPLIAWPLMMTLTLLAVLWATEKFGTNTLVVLVSFPLFGELWLGQTDWIILAGIILVFFAPSPWVRGFGIVLASLKPQLTLAAIPLALWYDHDRWKTVIIPVGVGVASLLVWGADWPIKWWMIRAQGFHGTAWVAAPFAYNPVPYLSIFLVKERQQKLAAALLSAALTIPAFGVYSYIVFLVVMTPWWAVPLSYAWIAGYPFLQNQSLTYAWILPLGLLIYLLWPTLKERWVEFRARRAKSTTPSEAS